MGVPMGTGVCPQPGGDNALGMGVAWGKRGDVLRLVPALFTPLQLPALP